MLSYCEKRIIKKGKRRIKYWIMLSLTEPKSQLTIENNILLFKQMTKPVLIYGTQLLSYRNQCKHIRKLSEQNTRTL